MIKRKGKGFEFGKTKKDFIKAKRRIVKIVANEALNHFLDGFEKGGYQTDASRKGWQNRSLQAGNKGRAILVQTNDLRSSIKIKRTIYQTLRGRIVIGTRGIKYAEIHNEGGEITITPKMRKFFWAMYYKNVKKTKSGGLKKRGNEIAQYYKNLALTKAKTIKIPQREFIGDSKKLNKKLDKTIKTQVAKVFPK